MKDVLIDHANRVTTLENEKRSRIRKIKLREDIDTEHKHELIADIEDEYTRRLAEEKERVMDEISRLIERYGLKTIETGGMVYLGEQMHLKETDFEHKHIRYLVYTIELDECTIMNIYANFTEGVVRGKYKFVFDRLEYEVVRLLRSDLTPFTYELSKRIQWKLLRPTHKRKIEQMVEEIENAELRGEDELREAVKMVKYELLLKSKIPEYEHAYHALLETEKKFNI